MSDTTTECLLFLSDVMTASGLVTHGKQSKELGERLRVGCYTVAAALQLINHWSGVAYTMQPVRPESTDTKAVLLQALAALTNLINSSRLKDLQPWRDARHESVQAIKALETTIMQLTQPDHTCIERRLIEAKKEYDDSMVHQNCQYNRRVAERDELAIKFATVEAENSRLKTLLGL